MQPIDKRGGTPWKSTIARDKPLTMMKEFAVVDIFRSSINSLLEDEKYVDLIRENYVVISEKYTG